MTELWWNRMGDWPRWFKYCMLLLIFGSGIVLGYQGWVSDLQDQWTTVLQQNNKLRNRIALDTAQMQDVSLLQSESQNLAANIAQQRQMWPVSMAMAEAVQQIAAAGESSGVEIQSISPGAQQSLSAASDWPGYNQFSMVLHMQGQYAQLGAFISCLNHLPMGLIPENFIVTALPDTLKNGQLQMTLFILLVAWPGTTAVPHEVFSHVADFDAGKTRNPFMPNQSNSKLLRMKQPLEFYSLRQLRYVGTIQRDDQTWGLVLTPEGAVHSVQPGDYLGENEDKVNAVTSHVLVVKTLHGQAVELPLQEAQ